jgi:hypothetical protein
LVYQGRLDPTEWPVLAGRRLVPEAELPKIRQVLARTRRREAVSA